MKQEKIKESLEQIVRKNIKNENVFKIKTRPENLNLDLQAIEEICKNDKRFEFGRPIIENFRTIVITIKLKSKNFGKYSVH